MNKESPNKTVGICGRSANHKKFFPNIIQKIKEILEDHRRAENLN
jgi:methylmalonyl-CoA mutase cobalamin-binding subunit